MIVANATIVKKSKVESGARICVYTLKRNSKEVLKFYKTVYNLEGHTPLWPLMINKYLALFIHEYVRGRSGVRPSRKMNIIPF